MVRNGRQTTKTAGQKIEVAAAGKAGKAGKAIASAYSSLLWQMEKVRSTMGQKERKRGYKQITSLLVLLLLGQVLLLPPFFLTSTCPHMSPG